LGFLNASNVSLAVPWSMASLMTMMAACTLITENHKLNYKFIHEQSMKTLLHEGRKEGCPKKFKAYFLSKTIENESSYA
jgi:hypothetical protein